VSIFDRTGLAEAMAGHTAVVKLTSAIPPMTKFMLKRAWRDSNRVRTEGSAALVDAAIHGRSLDVAGSLAPARAGGARGGRGGGANAPRALAGPRVAGGHRLGQLSLDRRPRERRERSGGAGRPYAGRHAALACAHDRPAHDRRCARLRHTARLLLSLRLRQPDDRGSGLTGYSVDGKRKFHIHGEAPVTGVQPLGTKALVGRLNGVTLIDARSGRELRRFRRFTMSLLAGDAPFY